MNERSNKRTCTCIFIILSSLTPLPSLKENFSCYPEIKKNIRHNLGCLKNS